jgi:hypothetical protein
MKDRGFFLVMKETFIIRTEWWDSIELLSDQGKLEIFNALFLHHLGKDNEIKITLNESKLCWNFILPALKYNANKYQQSVENGKKGGRPKKPKENLKVNLEETQNNLKVNLEKPDNNLIVFDNVIDNVIDNVFENVSDIVSGNEFVERNYSQDTLDKLNRLRLR